MSQWLADGASEKWDIALGDPADVGDRIGSVDTAKGVQASDGEVKSVAMWERWGDGASEWWGDSASRGPAEVAGRVASLDTVAKGVQASEGPELESTRWEPSRLNDVPPQNLSAFRSAGWDRLFPFAWEDSTGLPQYQAYLEIYYITHKLKIPVETVDAGFECLVKEHALRMCWLLWKTNITPSDAELSARIHLCMFKLVLNKGKSESPFTAVAAKCIEKEAELMTEWLKRKWEVPKDEYILCQSIRLCAWKLIMFPEKWSSDIPAVLLGIIKEAELLLDNMRLSLDSSYVSDSSDVSYKIRRCALDYLSYKLSEYENRDVTISEVK